MRAAVCPAYGPPEVVRICEIPSPQPGPGRVLVRVSAAAVNYPDVLLIADAYQLRIPPPFVPGSEFVGTVVQIGDTGHGTEHFAVGDRVAGTALHGAFAEQVVAAAATLTHVPGTVCDHDAAASGVAHRTAYHALRSVARVRAGDDVVVLGAGGGVGLAAVALAAHLGATVTAVASTAEKLAVAATHGARHLVDHRAQPLRDALRSVLPQGATVVIDPVGGALSEPALRSLGRGGRFVTIGFASGEIPRIPLNLVLVKGVTVRGFQFGDIAPDDMHRNERELADLLAGGRIRPHIGAVYPLADTAAALRLVADGRAVGKVVVDVAG
ncbi:NADPH:quinone oxidoreductase family protein [Mycobacterium sp. PS03-16]|uniref:NADPH:quinone oxidoreductase family protein n=1 Tax=Mycobacterium sp. PS03-16 TaxID=2559611 RepID=UPI00107471F9|nr:NADPH:quinone oxidoreductase family protein [Mycobacterium sp. PS03-16]TFV59790.1 NADPH:quinone oxidoreductase family protein [Mycobacterium sp. PS03-16]